MYNPLKAHSYSLLHWLLEEYGAGEDIDVTVRFDSPVAILPGGVLLLDTGGEDPERSGKAVYMSGNRTAALTFVYTVLEGDSTKDLGTFDGGDAGSGGGLVATVLRDSDAPTQVPCKSSGTLQTTLAPSEARRREADRSHSTMHHACVLLSGGEHHSPRIWRGRKSGREQ